jgi:hypothetical protein
MLVHMIGHVMSLPLLGHVIDYIMVSQGHVIFRSRWRTSSSHLCLELQQVDIKGAYLNGMLKEGEVLYM